MNIDHMVRKASRGLDRAIQREKRAAGRFVPPCLPMQKITAAVTGIGIALSDVSFRAQDFLCRGKFPQALSSGTEPDSFLECCEKNRIYIEAMLPRMEAKIEEFTAAGELFRESDFQFFKVSWVTMGETLKALDKFRGNQSDDRAVEALSALIELGAATFRLMNSFAMSAGGKSLH